MSVTIKPTQANGRPYPDKEVLGGPCAACAGGWCQPGWCRDGREIDLVCDAPMCNVTNSNAIPLLATVGLDAGPYLTGCIGADEVPGILRECEIALGHDVDAMVRRAPLLVPSSDTQAARGPRVIVQGTDDARARDRLERLREVLRWARDNSAGIAWD